MAIRLHFVLLLVVVSAMAQTFQLSFIIWYHFSELNFPNNSFPIWFERTGTAEAGPTVENEPILPSSSSSNWSNTSDTPSSLQNSRVIPLKIGVVTESITKRYFQSYTTAVLLCKRKRVHFQLLWRQQVNEDGDSWLVHVNHCAKLATSLVSVLKNKDVKSSDDDPLINVIH